MRHQRQKTTEAVTRASSSAPENSDSLVSGESLGEELPENLQSQSRDLPGEVPAGHRRAVALVGFYRGVSEEDPWDDIVMPEEVIDLPEREFWELRGFQKVDVAPT